jgi:succinate dehydrogenase / fumarate reductase iron-sulfur subunit
MKLTLKIWRQENAEAKGKIETHELTDLSPDMSFLEMLDATGQRRSDHS